MTHEAGTPWDEVWNHSTNREIPSEAIGAFFAGIPLRDAKEKFSGIPVVEPLYRKDGVPVFAAEEA